MSNPDPEFHLGYSSSWYQLLVSWFNRSQNSLKEFEQREFNKGTIYESEAVLKEQTRDAESPRLVNSYYALKRQHTEIVLLKLCEARIVRRDCP